MYLIVAKFCNKSAITVRALYTRNRGPERRIYEGIRGLLVNNEVFIWNCVSWKSSPFLFRVSPEIYEHLERTAVSAARGPERPSGRRRGRLSVILAFLEESNNDYSPGRSYIIYPPLTGRPAQSYCRLRRMDLSQLGTTRDSWYYYTRARNCIRGTL